MIHAVIDIGFGDSGKGMLTAYLCQNILNNAIGNPLVVRFSGGHQAGHTVIHNGIRHVFSSFGSGTLLGVPTYWSDNCTFYPIAFMNELNDLQKKGITPKIYVDGKCPVTTIYDVNHNKRQEEKNNHGSCGVGFGATLEREENYYSLLVEDLYIPTVRDMKLKQIRKYYGHYDTFKLIDYFKYNCDEVLKHIELVYGINKLKTKYNEIIYEGSQGLLLDKDIGFFPHVTRSNVGSRAIKEKNIHNLFYVTRAYQTRHGNGPMTNEGILHNIKKNPNETNTDDGFQGKFRRTLLDLDLLKYSILKDANKKNWNHHHVSLCITCLDHVENEHRFTLNGEVINCLNEKEFIERISKELEIEVSYISRSDDYKKIKSWYCEKNIPR